jgi:hypothetical protein
MTYHRILGFLDDINQEILEEQKQIRAASGEPEIPSPAQVGSSFHNALKQVHKQKLTR